jgi:hypothetical protein
MFALPHGLFIDNMHADRNWKVILDAAGGSRSDRSRYIDRFMGTPSWLTLYPRDPASQGDEMSGIAFGSHPMDGRPPKTKV